MFPGLPMDLLVAPPKENELGRKWLSSVRAGELEKLKGALSAPTRTVARPQQQSPFGAGDLIVALVAGLLGGKDGQGFGEGWLGARQGVESRRYANDMARFQAESGQAEEERATRLALAKLGLGEAENALARFDSAEADKRAQYNRDRSFAASTANDRFERALKLRNEAAAREKAAFDQEATRIGLLEKQTESKRQQKELGLALIGRLLPLIEDPAARVSFIKSLNLVPPDVADGMIADPPEVIRAKLAGEWQNARIGDMQWERGYKESRAKADDAYRSQRLQGGIGSLPPASGSFAPINPMSGSLDVGAKPITRYTMPNGARAQVYAVGEDFDVVVLKGTDAKTYRFKGPNYPSKAEIAARVEYAKAPIKDRPGLPSTPNGSNAPVRGKPRPNDPKLRDYDADPIKPDEVKVKKRG